MKKIAIIGAGGFGQEVFCVWKEMLNYNNETFEFIGFFDDNFTNTENAFGKVIGCVDEINNYPEELEVAIAIGNSNHIESISSKIVNPNISFPNVIHPSTHFYNFSSLVIQHGNIILPFVLISCNVNIGNFNIINSRSSLAHDVKVGNFNVISPNTQLNGNVVIKDKVFLGFNCGVLQNKIVESEVTIGAGAILYRDAKEKGTYIGNPASKLKITS